MAALKRRALASGEELISLPKVASNGSSAASAVAADEIPISIFCAGGQPRTDHRARMCGANATSIAPPNLDVWTYLRSGARGRG
jgi:hypothetical protein